MARFGIEGIRYCGNARAAGVTTSSDLSYTFNRANGLDNKLLPIFPIVPDLKSIAR